MAILILQLIVPGLLALMVIITVKLIRYPSPLVFGCMIPKVCAVLYDEILADIKKMEDAERPVGARLRWAVRWREFRLNWLYVCLEAMNTVLFLRTLRFEKLRIDRKKPGIKYDDREVLIYQLIEEVVKLRWQQVRCQIVLLVRVTFGLKITKEVFVSLLNQYKEFEADFVEFAGMENEEYQRSLIDKLGLRGTWGLVDGGNTPEPA